MSNGWISPVFRKFFLNQSWNLTLNALNIALTRIGSTSKVTWYSHELTFSTTHKNSRYRNDRDPFHHYLSNPRYHPENTRQHHSGTSPTNEETASSKRLLQRGTAEEDKGRKRRCESFPFELYNNNVIRLHGVRKQRRQRQYASFTSRYDIDHAVLYRSRIVGGWFFMSSRLSHKSRKSLWACVRMACFRPSITPCMLD